MNYSEMSYNALQSLVKERGLKPANRKKDALIMALIVADADQIAATATAPTVEQFASAAYTTASPTVATKQSPIGKLRAAMLTAYTMGEQARAWYAELTDSNALDRLVILWQFIAAWFATEWALLAGEGSQVLAVVRPIGLPLNQETAIRLATGWIAALVGWIYWG
jgi:hypothetical protein